MPNGFAPYLLKSLTALAGINYPGLKLTPAGFTGMLLENSNVVEAKLTNEQGHQKTAKVKYKTRQTVDTVSEEDNCDIDFTPVYKEADMTAVRFAKTGFHISMKTVSKYMEAASNPKSIGNPSVRVIAEIADSIAHAANSIVQKIDARLLSDLVWGNNVVSGNNAATTLNIGLDSTKNNLSGGFAKLLNDAFENQFGGTLLIVGSGIFNAHELQKAANAIGAAQNGIDLSKFNGYKFYPDMLAKTVWGTNQIGVFAPGSIHLVDFQKYVGFQAGKVANSTFFQISLPVNTGNGEVMMMFDAQLKELDCPTTLLDGYGNEGSYDRGYALFLSKRYGLFQTPADAFNSDDVLSGVNGALRYEVTNVCEEC